MNRWLATLFLGTCVSSVAMLGCGDDSAEDDDGGKPANNAEINPQAAGQVGQLTTEAVVQLRTGNGEGALGSLMTLGTSAFSLITPNTSGAQSVPASELGTTSSAFCEESCTETSCTFSGCSFEGSGASFTIDGTISWGGDKLDCDVTYKGSYSGYEYDFNLFCDLTVTDTSIDGLLKTKGNYAVAASGQDVTFDWDSKLQYNNVQFPAGGGCPTSGSVDVEASINTQGVSYSGGGSYTFDGTCL